MINNSYPAYIAEERSFTDVFEASIASLEAYNTVQNTSNHLHSKISAIFSSIEYLEQNLDLLESSREARQKVKERFNQIAAKISELKADVKAAKVDFAKSQALVNVSSSFAKSALLTSLEQEKVSKLIPGGEKALSTVSILTTAIIPKVEESIQGEVRLVQADFRSLNEKFSSLADQLALKLKVTKSYNHTFKAIPEVSTKVHSANVEALNLYGQAIDQHVKEQRDPLARLDADFEKQRTIASSYESYTPKVAHQEEVLDEPILVEDEVEEEKIEETQPQIAETETDDEPTLEELELMEQELLRQLELEKTDHDEKIPAPIQEEIVVPTKQEVILVDETETETDDDVQFVKEVIPQRVTRSKAKKTATVAPKETKTAKKPKKKAAPKKSAAKKTPAKKKKVDRFAVDVSNIIGDIDAPRSSRSRTVKA